MIKFITLCAWTALTGIAFLVVLMLLSTFGVQIPVWIFDWTYFGTIAAGLPIVIKDVIER